MKFKGLLKVALLLVAVSALFVACDTLAGGKFPVMFEPYEPEEGYIYLKPNANWLEEGDGAAPRFAVYTAPKDWSSPEWYDMEETEKDSGIYKVKLPADKKYHWVIFTRMNGSKTENNWDNKYNQSKDEVLVYADDDASNDKKVLYIVADGSLDKSSDSFWHNPEEYVDTPVKAPVVKENFFETAVFSGDIDGLTFTMGANNTATATFTYNSATMNKWGSTAGNVELAIQEENGTLAPKWCGAEVPVDGNFVELMKDDNENNIVIKGLEEGKTYKISLKYENEKVSIKVVATGNENERPQYFFEGADIEGAMGNLTLSRVDDNTTSANFVYDGYRMTGWGSSEGNVHFILRESAPLYDPRYANATLSANDTYVECTKATGGPDIIVDGLTTGYEYEITFKQENGRVYVKVNATGETQDITPPVNPDAVKKRTIYLDPGVWDDDTQVEFFEAWTWGGTASDSWIDFSYDEETCYYKAEILVDRTGIKVLRKHEGEHSSHAWESWNDTELSLSVDKNLIKIIDWNKTELQSL